MNPRQQTAVFVIIAVLSTAGVVGGIMYVILNPAAPEGNVVEVYNWWTSGGEAAAISALIDVFEAQYPGTLVSQRQIAGGSGTELRANIKNLMLALEPPDTFQIHAGYEWWVYYEGNLLDTVNHIWTQDLKDAIPDVVEDMNKGPDGNYYSVPVNIHRSNVIWYNKDILDNNGIDPLNLTTWDALFWACGKIQANEMDISFAMTMGEEWTQAHAFETVMASQGMDAYEAWINGDITSSSSTYYGALLQACNDFSTLTSNYVDSGNLDKGWDDALALLIDNSTPYAAFNIMGDWADGEFQQAEWHYDVHYGTIPVPGTNVTYGLVVDCFEKPKYIKHPTNVDKWLTVVGSVAGQDAFNPLKGSIPARTDCNTSDYGDYQQGAMANFSYCSTTDNGLGHFFPSVVHGSGMPEGYVTELKPIIGVLAGGGDATTAANAIAALAVKYDAKFTRTWNLI